MKGLVKQFLKYSSIGLAVMAAPQIHAAGLKLEMQSSSVLADAGDAAVVEDAGTNWYNSAGLVYLPQQFVASAIDVYGDTTFRGTSTAPNIYSVPPASLPNSLAPRFTGTGKASSHPNSILPAFHYSLPFKDRFAFGISIVPAWGLAHNYGRTSVVRYNLTQINTRTIDVTPSLAYKFNDHWSLGAGPDFHYFKIESQNNSRTQNVVALSGAAGDSRVRSVADGWNYGGHIGILYRYDEATRIGLNYRSQIVNNVSGDSTYSFFGGGPTYTTGSFKLRLTTPPTTSLSAYHDVNSRWAVMGTLAYDQWSVLRNLNAKGYMFPDGVARPVTQALDHKNTVDIGAGLHYTLNEMWMFRANFKYEPTPTINKYRDINFPDGDKLGFQIGARCQMSKKVKLDMLYGHVFIKQESINFTNLVTGVVTNGNTNTSLNLVGGQVVWDI